MAANDNTFSWDRLSWPKKALIVIPLAGAFIGWQFHTKGEEARETKAEMLAMCEGEAPCIAAVEQHAESCFKDNYSMSRDSQGVNMDEFVACVNEKAGSEMFVSVPEE